MLALLSLNLMNVPQAWAENTEQVEKSISIVQKTAQAEYISLPQAIKKAAEYQRWLEGKIEKTQNGQTFYYNSNAEQQANKEGSTYYRTIIGKLADGRLVGQDFYSHNNRPQVAPFVLRQDADITSFDSKNVDGLLTWYTPCGELMAQSDNKHGAHQERSPHFAYAKDKLTMRVQVNGDDHIEAFLYDNKGVLRLAHIEQKQNVQTLFYYDNGQIAAHIVGEEGAAWDKQGNPLDEADEQEQTRLALQITIWGRRLAAMMDYQYKDYQITCEPQ